MPRCGCTNDLKASSGGCCASRFTARRCRFGALWSGRRFCTEVLFDGIRYFKTGLRSLRLGGLKPLAIERGGVAKLSHKNNPKLLYIREAPLNNWERLPCREIQSWNRESWRFTALLYRGFPPGRSSISKSSSGQRADGDLSRADGRYRQAA